MKKDKFFRIFQSDVVEGFITHEDQEIDNLRFAIIGDLLTITSEDDSKGNSNLNKWKLKKRHTEITQGEAENYIKQEREKEINQNDKFI